MTHEPDRQDPEMNHAGPARPGHEPIFNIPNVVLAMLLVMVAIQVALDSLLPQRAVLEIILQGAFIPQRYSVPISAQVGPYLCRPSPIRSCMRHGPSWC